MDIEKLYQLYLANKLISTDSRQVVPGSLFFALKGGNFNGNAFAKSALEKGAEYAIVDEKEHAYNDKCIIVDDVLKSLQQLANFHRKHLSIPVIGITGSNGKTTTKELLHIVLNSTYKTFATKGNLNNHIGVPLSLLSIDESYQLAIIEMGANHPGEIRDLCGIAEPDFGLITNIGKAHLEGFGSFEGVINTKTELYRFINQKNGVLFVNAGNSLLLEQSEKVNCRKEFYGSHEKSKVWDTDYLLNPYLNLQVHTSNKTNAQIKTHLAGTYNKENILAAICVGKYFNIELDVIAAAIASYIPENNRSQIIKTSKNTLVCDYYNANPSSMEAALNNFSQTIFDKTKKILMLGAMKELGADSEIEHEKLVSLSMQLNFTHIFWVGEEFRNCNLQQPHFKSSEELADYLKENEIRDAAILIKGSRGSKMELVVPFL